MFDFTKTYAAKKGILAALKSNNIEIQSITVHQNEEGRWYAVAKEVAPAIEFEASQAELAAQATRQEIESAKLHVQDHGDTDAKQTALAQSEVANPVANEKVESVKAASAKQNGITYPRAGGLCWQAWELFNELGKGVDIKTALTEGYKRNLNDNNIRTELCRWRKYHGIQARATKG